MRALAGMLFALASAACQDLSVSAVPIEAIEVQPSSATLLIGQTLEMSYVALDERGNELSGRLVEWSVRDSDVAQVRSNGVVTALGTGQTVIEARSEGVTGEAALEVLSAPAIGLEPDSVEFTAVEGGSDPPSQRVQIENVGSGSLTGLNIAVEYPEGGATGWLSAQLLGTSAPAEVVIRVDIGSLTDGTYTGSVVVQSAVAGNSPQVIDVTLTVEEPPPAIALDPSSWATSTTYFSPDTVSTEVDVTNGGGSQLVDLAVDSIHYERPEYAGWLEAELAATVAPTILTLRAYGRKGGFILQPDTYEATVFLSAPDASNSPATLPVTFRVEGI